MSDEQISLSRAEQALENGSAEEAIQILKRLLQEQADNCDAKALLGEALIEVGRLDDQWVLVGAAGTPIEGIREDAN